jgi:hypothetical protein
VYQVGHWLKMCNWDFKHLFQYLMSNLKIFYHRLQSGLQNSSFVQFAYNNFYLYLLPDSSVTYPSRFNTVIVGLINCEEHRLLKLLTNSLHFLSMHYYSKPLTHKYCLYRPSVYFQSMNFHWCQTPNLAQHRGKRSSLDVTWLLWQTADKAATEET